MTNLEEKKISEPRDLSSRGLFITFEGGDGCGKSTQIRLLRNRLEEMGRDVLVPREPGSTAIGEKIRDILLDRSNQNMTPETELLLFEASRAQNTSQIIRPAMKAGKIVMCDRFYDSSTAYQGYGRGMDIETIKNINMYATKGLVPDRTILMLRNSADEGLENAANVGSPDRLELAGHDFHNRVLEGFKQLAEEDPQRWRVVHLQDSIEKTAEDVFDAVKDLL